MKKVDFQMLVDYLQGDLDEVERAVVEQHIQHDPHGREEVARARQTVARLQEAPLAAPPPSLLGRVQAAFQQKRRAQANRVRHEALLQFDSWAQPSPVGVRGLPQERQLLFHQGNYDLDLQVVTDRAANAYIMRGQLLSDSTTVQHELEGIALNLRHPASGQERRSLTDAYGRFTFSHLDQGNYVLLVELQSYDIVIVLESLAITG